MGSERRARNPVVAVGAADRAEAGAVGAVQREGREPEDEGVPGHGVEGQAVVGQHGVALVLVVGGLEAEQLATWTSSSWSNWRRQRTQPDQHGGADRAGDEQALDHALDLGVDGDGTVGRDRGHRGGQVAQGRAHQHVLVRSRASGAARGRRPRVPVL
jgi:hypothetical protein